VFLVPALDADHRAADPLSVIGRPESVVKCDYAASVVQISSLPHPYVDLVMSSRLIRCSH